MTIIFEFWHYFFDHDHDVQNSFVEKLHFPLFLIGSTTSRMNWKKNATFIFDHLGTNKRKPQHFMNFRFDNLSFRMILRIPFFCDHLATSDPIHSSDNPQLNFFNRRQTEKICLPFHQILLVLVEIRREEDESSLQLSKIQVKLCLRRVVFHFVFARNVSVNWKILFHVFRVLW